ncbi:MAG: hypothetical protein SGPRY_011583 [Prymnesium sp.]
MVCLEACLLPRAVSSRGLGGAVLSLLRASGGVSEGQLLDLSLTPQLQQARLSPHPTLSTSVCDVSGGVEDGRSAPASIHIHQLYEEDAAEETADESEESSVAFCMWTLPALEFDGLWESLLYEEDVKPKLLRYVSTAMRFSELGVDARVVGWNRVVLLHGHLIEVNAHSLFSKWFSESGKMVLGMFTKIREILEDGDAFVCVLIDEVESLTAARQAAITGSEPSDAVRVVNAVLTQLDALRAYKNALVLTTSNLTTAIDAAFVDRADIKQYVGQPGVRARYMILATCLAELGRAGGPHPFGVVEKFGPFLSFDELLPILPDPPPTFDLVQACEACNIWRVEQKHVFLSHSQYRAWQGLSVLNPAERGPKRSMMLYAIAKECDGLSGRALRKLPFMAHALFSSRADAAEDIDLFLIALHRGVQVQMFTPLTLFL